MTIQKVHIRGFRCFDRYDIELDQKVTVITGPNASGKTSVLEALHVAARLRSFRTPTITDLIKQGSEAFSIRVNAVQNEVHVAYGAQTHIAEINGVGPATRGMLMQTAPVVVVTEQDIDIVQGYPEIRRLFLDQTSVMRQEPEAERLLGKYQQIYRQRAALLNDQSKWNRGTYEIITEQMWKAANNIRAMRQSSMASLEQEMRQLLESVMPEITCKLNYKVSEYETDVISPYDWCRKKEEDERHKGRSLMGAHLDDMEIIFQQKQARRFVSRGMQKVIAVLMKIAQAKKSSVPATLLLDDLLADFDEQRLEKIMAIATSTNLQLVFTAPSARRSTFANKYPFPSTAYLVHLVE